MTTQTRTGSYPRHRTVFDVMTLDVVTVTPDTGFKEIARLLTERSVSALPVVEQDGRLVGIVSEQDLLAKERRLDPPVLSGMRRNWREEHARAEANVAGELMSTPAVSVDGGATLRQAARLMHSKGLRRLCVIDGAGHLAGIVTRGDLLRAFVRSDDEIEREVREGVALGIMWLDPSGLTVEVTDGVVRLTGELQRSSESEILTALVSGLDGVVAVDTELTWRFDDRALSAAMSPRFER
ncbi:MAG TPA: CBS domain-containing protein [Acidimicrobiia bacterium]|nr:CBS domain-containing protein [Acidimicrobiia bacterium]